jgi:hypothetical protein
MRDDSDAVTAVVDETVLAGLRARGVIDENKDVHRAVLAGMVVLADPGAVRFTVVAASTAMARRTTLALSDTTLAGLTVEEPSGRSEHLLAGTGCLGSELTRLLPTLHERPSPGRQTLRGIHPGRLQVAVEAIQTAHQLQENPLDEASLGGCRWARHSPMT